FNGQAMSASQPRKVSPPFSPNSINNTYLFDPVANSWSAGPNLILARSFADAATVNVTGGQMATIVGGYNSTSGTSLTSVEGSTAPVVACATNTVGATATRTAT